MNISAMARKALACAVALAGAVSFAADMAVGKWERKTIDADTPAVGVGEGLYICENAASLSYAGIGMWTLPLGNLFAFGDTELGVRSGTLRLASSATPDLVANPPTELNKAALWLDAGKNVQTNVINGETCALAWFDAREPSASASSYGYATAGDISGSGPKLDYVNRKALITFRGYTASNTKRSFSYKTVDGTPRAYDIRHAFFVRYSTEPAQTAPVLGSTTAANFFAAADGMPPAMLAANGVANPLAYSSEYLLDGVQEDPTSEGSMIIGAHVHEFTLPPNRTIQVDSLMRDRNLASGGKGIHEILLFTEPLTVLERARITAYLKAKWSCGGYSSMTVRTSAGSAVELAGGATPDSVYITGQGVAVAGAGASCEVAHLYSEAGAKRAPYALNDGMSSLAFQATEYEYHFSPCDRVTVDASDKYSTLTKDVAGVSGCVSATSARPFVVSKLDPAITNLAFSGGGNLVLRAPSSDSSYEAGTASAATFATTSLSVPSGQAGVETTVEVPVAGNWEIEFKMYNDLTPSVDSGYGDKGAYRVQLRSGDSVAWERIPTVLAPTAYNDADQTRRYLVRNLAAGTYTFRVEGYETDARAASMSNLSMSFVPNMANETVVPVTDGDFESSRFRRPYFAAVGNNTRTAGWTLTTPASENPTVLTIVSSAMGLSDNNAYSKYMFRSSQMGRYGDNALLWYHNNSTAASPATTLPAGTYRLRLDAVRWMTGTNNHTKVDSGSRCNDAATLSASIKVNGGEPISLGSIGPISNFTAARLIFPTSFAASEGDSVVVVLNQTTSRAAVQIDNLEFAKVEDGGENEDDGEFVVNGSVENGSTGWTLDDWTDGFRRVAQVRSPLGENFGETLCDGTNVIRSAQGGRAYQTIAFPEGVFRLSWWSRARVDRGNVSFRTPITFWYAGVGAATTNEIITSEMSWCTNFTEHVAYFSVPTDGDYVFGFNSEERDGADVLVDCVSVKQVSGAEATPEISERTMIDVAGGGKLRLDYNGCLKLAKVRVNGVPLKGEISAATYPELVCGPGRAVVPSKGFIMVIR